MQSFKDKNGQDWDLGITLFDILRIEAYDFSICYTATGREPPFIDEEGRYHIQMNPPAENLFSELITDPAVCFAMIWIICQEQAEKREIKTELEFSRLFTGATCMEARAAFYKELPDFFPQMKTTLKTLLDRMLKFQEVADTRISREVETVLSDEEMHRVIEETLAGDKSL